jgi:hypothetical protein
MDIQRIYQLTLIILSLGLIIVSIEDVKSWSVFSSGGLLSWKVGRLNSKWSKYLDWLFNETRFKKILYLKLAASCALFVLAVLNVISPLLLCFIFLCHASVAIRSSYGLDGAYQMYFITLLALSIGSLSSVGSRISELCLWFIACELMLSYFIAGFAKLISPIWTKSYALSMIFSTRSYGHYNMHQWIIKNNIMAVFLCWGVLIFETFFVIILFLPMPYAIFFCVIGCCFHLFNALFMGLNDFLFSFLAAYPALFYCIQVLK